MNSRTRFTFTGLMVLISLVTSIALPITAFADGAPTPPPSSDSSGSAQPAPASDTSAPAQPAQPADTSAPSAPTDPASAPAGPVIDAASPDAAPADAAPTDAAPTDAAATDVAPTETPALTDAAPTDAASTDAPTVPQILNAAPAGTDLVALDANGQPQALGSEAAAATLITGDPMWCPDGISPGGTGCTGAHISLNNLIADLQAHSSVYTGSGTVYVEQGTVTDAGSYIVFDHQNTPGLTDLVFQGGWNGLMSGSSAIVGTSTIAGPGNLLIFLNWGPGNLTLRDINVTGDGMFIGTYDDSHPSSGNVTLDTVNVTNTPNGAVVKTAGDVTVSNSHFDNNSKGAACPTNPDGSINCTTGLFIKSDGNVNLSNVSANGNHGNGLEVYGFHNDHPSSVTIQSSDFNLNTITPSEASADDNYWSQGWGFVIGNGTPAPATVTLDGVSSSNNTRGATVFSNGDVTIGNSFFDSNDTASPAGLTVWSGGVVTLNSVSASYNTGDGADIFGPNNGGSPGDPWSGSPTSVVIQNSVFNNNAAQPFAYDGVDGLWITFGSGGATVSGSIFFGNAGYGLGGAGTGTLRDYGNYYGRNIFGNVQVDAAGGTLTRSLTFDQLPAALPQGFTFVDAMSVISAAAGAQASFDIPAGTAGPFTVLSWNGTQWVEVASSVVGGKVVFTPGGPATFVLATH